MEGTPPLLPGCFGTCVWTVNERVMPFFVRDCKCMVLRSNVSLTALPVEETENELQEESIMDALNVDEDYKHETVKSIRVVRFNSCHCFLFQVSVPCLTGLYSC